MIQHRLSQFYLLETKRQCLIKRTGLLIESFVFKNLRLLLLVN